MKWLIIFLLGDNSLRWLALLVVSLTILAIRCDCNNLLHRLCFQGCHP